MEIVKIFYPELDLKRFENNKFKKSQSLLGTMLKDLFPNNGNPEIHPTIKIRNL